MQFRMNVQSFSYESQLVCPVCGSTDIIFNEETGEYVCRRCGAVVMESVEATAQALATGQLSIQSQYKKTRDDDYLAVQTFTLTQQQDQAEATDSYVNPAMLPDSYASKCSDCTYAVIEDDRVLVVRVRNSKAYKKAEAVVSSCRQSDV